MFVLSLVFSGELVENRVHGASESRACKGFQEVRRSDNLLNYSVGLFFIVEILLKPVHVASLHYLDDGIWMSDLIDKTFPGSKDECKSDSATHTISNQNVEWLNTHTCEEGATDKHTEQSEVESSVQTGIILLLLTVQPRWNVWTISHNSFTLLVWVYLEIFQFLFCDERVWLWRSDKPHVRASILQEYIIHLVVFNDIRICLIVITHISWDGVNIFSSTEDQIGLVSLLKKNFGRTIFIPFTINFGEIS